MGTKTPAFSGTFVEPVYTNGNYGFFSAVLASYRNHWALRTCPEDWWYTIIHKIATAIDESSSKESVKNFFVNHQGKKKIIVLIPKLKGTNFSWLFDQMTQGITDNIKVPSYVKTFLADFSTSADYHKICSQIAVMASAQEYFDYEIGGISCGIPALEMEGTIEDWRNLKKKFKQLRTILSPIHNEIPIDDTWWNNVERISDRLISTYEGNADTQWWKEIFSVHSMNMICGPGPTIYEGWFITELLGLKDILKLSDLRNAIISAPITIKDFSSSTLTVPSNEP